MKSFIGSIIILLAFMFSCNNEISFGGDKVSIRIRVVIVDEELNDRLNPESSSYFGDEYVENIKVVWQAIRDDNDKVLIKSDNPNQPISDPDVHSKRGLYFIWCSPYGVDYIDEDNKDYKDLGWSVCKYPTITDIYYPDGSKDEIKAELIYRSGKNGTVLSIGKIWVNDELAYEFVSNNQIENPYLYPYYNPEYYPWLRPIYDNNGNLLKITEDTELDRHWIVLKK